MFSNSELQARANRLLSEQKARAEKERQRLEKERILKERQRAREQEREEDARRKRLEAQQAEERAREAEFEERERNRGVFLRLELQALPADEAAVQAKGVRRSRDKILLPPSAGASLMDQDASKNGAMLFEVALPGAESIPAPPSAASASTSASTGAAPSSAVLSAALASTSTPATSGPAGWVPGRTHAGVLEFTAPEGTVLLPRKVVQSLYGSLDAVPRGTVVVTYRRLEKGDYVRLQPMSHGFHEAMGEGLREALEGELLSHSTLTEGDWVTVTADGRDWPLRVQELTPCPAVSVLDVDIAADVVPSLEAEEYLRRWEEEQAAAAARLAALAAERAEREAAEAAAAAAAAAEAEAAAAAAAQAREAHRLLLASSLPPEPEPSTSGSGSQAPVTCAFTLPEGSRIVRRFTPDTAVQVLYDFVDSRGAGGWDRGSYQLVTRMPRRVVGLEEAGAGRTVAELGLGQGGPEALLLEALAPPEAAAKGEPMEVDGSAAAGKGMAAA
ncbi:hypothetical protein HYH03_002250 [Edaphochlamys debaryana]|uniref:UBX domain-containing protein n=1 Tax=Edaphochlamys debaryana TaxID=47281 RepID=A0A835YBM5_9CHLO|nr:hypothetical protein HYH03_002250 [Edaphochlamys debaryana]|eukprot:KAG2499965.1 hypothetical protein HYH03_002250 [Edaphochlamys debaryana]